MTPVSASHFGAYRGQVIPRAEKFGKHSSTLHYTTLHYTTLYHTTQQTSLSQLHGSKPVIRACLTCVLYCCRSNPDKTVLIRRTRRYNCVPNHSAV